MAETTIFTTAHTKIAKKKDASKSERDEKKIKKNQSEVHTGQNSNDAHNQILKPLVLFVIAFMPKSSPIHRCHLRRNKKKNKKIKKRRGLEKRGKQKIPVQIKQRRRQCSNQNRSCSEVDTWCRESKRKPQELARRSRSESPIRKHRGK
jgi:hypothetical protein